MRQNRRAFIGSAAAVATTAAGVTFLGTKDLTAQGAAHAHGGDAVHAELIRQMQASVKALRETGKAEHARAIASLLRVAAAQGEAMGLDATWKNGLAAHVRRYGRSDAISRPIDRQRWDAEMRGFGDPNPELPLVSAADREKGLDALLTSGITPTLRSAAAAFDQAAVRLAERTAAGAAMRVQFTDCSGMRHMLDILQWEQTIACSMAWIDDGVACAFISGTIVGYYAMLWWYGC